MKIAYFVSRYPLQCQTFIRREIDEMVRRGQDVTIFPIVSTSADVGRYASDACACTAVRYVSIRVKAIYRAFKANPKVCLSLAVRLFLDTAYRPATCLKSFVALARGLSLYGIIQDGGFDHIHAHWASYPTTAAMTVSRLTGISFSFAFHAYDLFETRIELKEKLKAASLVVLNSQYSVEFLERCYPGAPMEKCMLLYNGLPPDRFAAAPRTEAPSVECPHILAVGRLVATKGFDYLIEACHLLAKEGRSFRVTLVGSGPDAGKLSRLIRKCGLEQVVTMPGERPQQDIRSLLSEAAMLVMPCVAPRRGASHDALPNVIIESQAAGVPVVATDLFAIPETVVHEEAGLLVIPRDAMALKNAMARLLDEPALAQRLARQGWQDAHARFDVQANVDRLLLNFERIHNDA